MASLDKTSFSTTTITRDLIAGSVVFLVALPLCLGVALASGAPLFAGLMAGIIGGMLVGGLSGSHTSISGPSPGIAAVVASQIAQFGSFHAFLPAVIIAGVIQIVFAALRVGFIADFVPSSVINGLLAAIGVLLVLKQLPHLFGIDTDPEGDLAFLQPDNENTFSELGNLLDKFHPGAMVIGLVSIVVLVAWGRSKRLKNSLVPAQLVVVLLGVGLAGLFSRLGTPWAIEASHLVQVPVAERMSDFASFIAWPDFSQWANPALYVAGITLALVASLETLLNLEAANKIDPKQRTASTSRELLAQGVGNLTAGFLGGLPVTSAIIRSSININAGAETKLSAIVHGALFLVCVTLLPTVLNLIPLSCLAAILLVTGVKLAGYKLFKRMWDGGRHQFLPFIVTVVAIVLTDLLIGILIGLAVSVSFILISSLRRPIRRFVEKHLGGNVVKIELADQMSFLNRGALVQALDAIPRGGHLLLDAHATDYIDPDVLELIRTFEKKTAPVRDIKVSLTGFRDKYSLRDRIEYVDYSSRELQQRLTPLQVLQILKDGHQRFMSGHRLTRDFSRQVSISANEQHPLAVVLGCMDSRSSAELICDLGVGDIFNVRVAGNILSREVLGSIEYGCAVAGAKLVVVMGHTQCGAVTSAVKLLDSGKSVAEATGCQHIECVLEDIRPAIDLDRCRQFAKLGPSEQKALVNEVARANVEHIVELLERESRTLRKLLDEKKIMVVGAMYDVATGGLDFMTRETASGLENVT
ncbi:MAG TPA: SulP family inorganic anion transporter [Pirellulales bacterium]|nr:SulP family inorganic anion transporter [Pirellulales bacterium]